MSTKVIITQEQRKVANALLVDAKTTSAKIRILYSNEYSRGVIRRILHISHQHCYNIVLSSVESGKLVPNKLEESEVVLATQEK